MKTEAAPSIVTRIEELSAKYSRRFTRQTLARFLAVQHIVFSAELRGGEDFVDTALKEMAEYDKLVRRNGKLDALIKRVDKFTEKQQRRARRRRRA